MSKPPPPQHLYSGSPPGFVVLEGGPKNYGAHTIPVWPLVFHQPEASDCSRLPDFPPRGSGGRRLALGVTSKVPNWNWPPFCFFFDFGEFRKTRTTPNPSILGVSVSKQAFLCWILRLLSHLFPLLSQPGGLHIHQPGEYESSAMTWMGATSQKKRNLSGKPHIWKPTTAEVHRLPLKRRKALSSKRRQYTSAYPEIGHL